MSHFRSFRHLVILLMFSNRKQSYSEAVFDLFLHRALTHWARGESPPAEAKRRLLREALPLSSTRESSQAWVYGERPDLASLLVQMRAHAMGLTAGALRMV
jgi:hypothetical protein